MERLNIYFRILRKFLKNEEVQRFNYFLVREAIQNSENNIGFGTYLDAMANRTTRFLNQNSIFQSVRGGVCKRLEQPNWMQQLPDIIGEWGCSFNDVDLVLLVSVFDYRCSGNGGEFWIG